MKTEWFLLGLMKNRELVETEQTRLRIRIISRKKQQSMLCSVTFLWLCAHTIICSGERVREWQNVLAWAVSQISSF